MALLTGRVTVAPSFPVTVYPSLKYVESCLGTGDSEAYRVSVREVVVLASSSVVGQSTAREGVDSGPAALRVVVGRVGSLSHSLFFGGWWLVAQYDFYGWSCNGPPVWIRRRHPSLGAKGPKQWPNFPSEGLIGKQKMKVN